MLYIKKYYKVFILNLLLFLTLAFVVSFVQKSQKLFVYEARLIIEQNNNKNSDENLISYLYPTKEDEPPYQKILDYIVSNYTIEKFIMANNYNFEILEREPKNLKIKGIQIYKPFKPGQYKLKTNEINDSCYIISEPSGYVSIRFLDYDDAVKKFTSKLNLKVTSSSEFIKSKNLPQFSPNIIYISFSSKDEYEGEMFKSFINFLFEDNFNQKKETYTKLKTLIRNQIQYYNNEVENIDENIKSVQLQIVNNPNVVSGIVSQIYLTQMEIRNLLNYLNDGSGIVLTSDSVVNSYLNKIRMMEDSLKVISLKYGRESNEYNYLRLVLDSLKANIKNVVEKRIYYLNEELKVLRNREAEFKQISDNAIELENQLNKLNTQKQSIMEILSLLNKKLKEIEMEEVSMRNDFKLFQISDKPIIKSKLNSLTRNVVFSILFALLFSIMIVLLSEYLKSSIRSAQELQMKLNIRNVFDIPYISDEEDEPFNIYISKNYQKIVNGSYAIESFRIMVLKTLLNQNKKTIGVVSSIQGEGKSYITLNISAILCMMKYNVVIVDTDLRKKSLSYYFQLNNIEGLSNIIETNDYQHLVCELNGNLFLVPAGNNIIDPLGIFINAKFKNFLQFLSNSFDYVLLDLPPVLGISESNVIADCLDGLLFVVRSDRTSLNQVSKSLQMLNREKILGFILNGTDYESSYYEYYYYKQNALR